MKLWGGGGGGGGGGEQLNLEGQTVYSSSQTSIGFWIVARAFRAVACLDHLMLDLPETRSDKLGCGVWSCHLYLSPPLSVCVCGSRWVWLDLLNCVDQ